MTEKDFWLKSKIAVIGGGSWGTVLASLASNNCENVRLWVRDDEQARVINSTRTNPAYIPEMQLSANVKAYAEIERVFEGGVQGVLWALPSSVCRELARKLAPAFGGEEIVIHATKGVEEGTLRRVSEILREELPVARIGVVSGPNLANEVARGEPAATVVASRFDEVIAAGQAMLSTDRFRVYAADDVIGVEWAGTLKNILAIASGALDALQFGWNARSMLLTRGLAEMVRFGVALGGKPETFLGLAGMGDLLATCSSPLSRNYRVGNRLAKGEKLPDILKSLGSTAEGVRTAKSVYEFAKLRGIEMPITEGVYHLIHSGYSVQDVMSALMVRPQRPE